ncbi:MAG: hypothetical protein COV02_00625 [Candidatus Terrybacteria bacterium CG10_big_fil_rev_8_21_14_0_10_41_10]|uniref:Penicillin-binding protein 2 n=1 Tax=Candidatus Terrybacteria bacterium CG10_big_fil_rev_8_21_14_0_10_41_10 TaxID=1975026 RepID=A0A2M8LB28_9BACT|nr:MAG: hypothetical protein COV02_00625 [Candidatus Terrybacteria bacterium CG10_big_fil_rev_8_21_14_0_10_41_10]
MKDGFKARTRIIYLIIFLTGIIMTTRLFFLQVVNSEQYKNEANKQHFSPAAKNFDRGSIFFTEKSGRVISAAVVKNAYQIYMNPKVLEDSEDAYAKLSKIVSVNKTDFMAKAAKKNDPYEVIMHKVDKDKALAVDALNIKGLEIYPESWRYYPAGKLASHVLGFVGYKGDSLVGRYGLELAYEKKLKRDLDKKPVNSFAEIFYGIKKIVAGGLENADITLTLEPTVQSMLEKKLEEILEKYKGKMSGGIIMEPSTGKIVAMSAKPDFDPNFYSEEENIGVFTNPLVESVFEMGSIAKPLTMAAAIDGGGVRPDTMYTDNGFVKYGSAIIKNYDGKARGKVDMQEVLSSSLNTGAVFAMQSIGKEKFSEYIRNYGMGNRTGIELPNEVSGKISNIIDNNRELEYATASFGQGIAVTPMEMTVALASLANGGKIVKPYLVDKITIDGFRDKKTQPEVIRQVISKEASEDISRMLVKVVDGALLGGKYKMENYTVAAKTGTAQYMEAGSKNYSEEEYLHTFFGYVPAFEAKFIVFLFVAKPQGVLYASHTLTEPFMDITKFLLNYYEVPPDR